MTNTPKLKDLTILGVGIVVGAGLGLIFARTTGRELRGGLRARLSRKSKSNGEPAVAAGAV